MRNVKSLSTVLELCGAVAFTAGAAVVFGVGVALMVGGGLGIVFGVAADPRGKT